MLCPNCGAAVGDSVRLCDQCHAVEAERDKERLAQEAEQQARFDADNKTLDELIPAGFWLRVFAYFIDGAFLTLVSQAVVVSEFPLLLPQVGILAGLSVLGTWLYFAGCEASPMQGTFGKSLFGLDVTDMHGERISFLRATGRYIAKYLAFVPVFLAVIFGGAIGFAGSAGGGMLVMLIGGGLSFLISVATYGIIPFTKHKQGLHDLTAKTLVVRNVVHPFGRYVLFALFSIFLFGVSIYYNFQIAKRQSSQFERVEKSLQSKNGGKTKVGIRLTNEPPSVVSTTTLPKVVESEQQVATSETTTPETNDFVPDSTASSSSSTAETISQPPPPEIAPSKTGWGNVGVGEDAKIVEFSDQLAMFYPANNRLDIAFYRNPLSESERQSILQGQYLVSPQVYTRPVLLLILVFEDRAKGVVPSNIKSYSLNFYRETSGSFTFPGFAHTVALFRDKKTAKLSELPVLSGSLLPDGEVKGSMKGSDIAKSIKTKFKWDFHFQAKILEK